MPADALAPKVTRASAGIVLTVLDRDGIVLTPKAGIFRLQHNKS